MDPLTIKAGCLEALQYDMTNVVDESGHFLSNQVHENALYILHRGLIHHSIIVRETEAITQSLIHYDKKYFLKNFQKVQITFT